MTVKIKYNKAHVLYKALVYNHWRIFNLLYYASIDFLDGDYFAGINRVKYIMIVNV